MKLPAIETIDEKGIEFTVTTWWKWTVCVWSQQGFYRARMELRTRSHFTVAQVFATKTYHELTTKIENILKYPWDYVAGFSTNHLLLLIEEYPIPKEEVIHLLDTVYKYWTPSARKLIIDQLALKHLFAENYRIAREML